MSTSLRVTSARRAPSPRYQLEGRAAFAVSFILAFVLGGILALVGIPASSAVLGDLWSGREATREVAEAAQVVAPEDGIAAMPTPQWRWRWVSREVIPWLLRPVRKNEGIALGPPDAADAARLATHAADPAANGAAPKGVVRAFIRSRDEEGRLPEDHAVQAKEDPRPAQKMTIAPPPVAVDPLTANQREPKEPAPGAARPPAGKGEAPQPSALPAKAEPLPRPAIRPRPQAAPAPRQPAARPYVAPDFDHRP